MILSKLFAIFAIALMPLSSCTKEKKEADYDYKSSSWYGTYPVEMLNNDTQELEEHTACIGLEFCNEGNECVVTTGISDMYASNMARLEVKWNSGTSFVLYLSISGQTNTWYSGKISGNKMSLDLYSCNEVWKTVELVRQTK